jgi:hypothetical protein
MEIGTINNDVLCGLCNEKQSQHVELYKKSMVTNMSSHHILWTHTTAQSIIQRIGASCQI